MFAHACKLGLEARQRQGRRAARQARGFDENGQPAPAFVAEVEYLDITAEGLLRAKA